MRSLIGLSLSLCVQDIMDERVSLDEVAVILSGTKFKTESDWSDGLVYYSVNYWHAQPSKADQIVQTLRETGRILQPRLQGHRACNISDGHWLLLTDEPVIPKSSGRGL